VAVTKWAGQVGASFVLASLSFNGWAARGSKPILVASTDGKDAVCYNPPYAIGFLPFAMATIVILIWAAFMFISSQFIGSKRLEMLYGGLNPFIASTCPGNKDPLLIWRGSEPQLEVVQHGEVFVDESRQTVLDYVTSLQRPKDGIEEGL
jgi:hypothetical protein